MLAALLPALVPILGDALYAPPEIAATAVACTPGEGGAAIEMIGGIV